MTTISPTGSPFSNTTSFSYNSSFTTMATPFHNTTFTSTGSFAYNTTFITTESLPHNATFLTTPIYSYNTTFTPTGAFFGNTTFSTTGSFVYNATFITTTQQPICMNSNLITFENISEYSTIPNGYYGLDWFNAHVLDVLVNPLYVGTGFSSAARLGTGVAFNMNGDSMTIRIPVPNKFNLKSFVVSSAWDDNVTLSMVAQRGSTYYKEASFQIEKNRSTTIELNWFDINTITFYASNNNNRDKAVFVIDNLCVDVITNMTSTLSTPAPGIIDQCPSNEVLYENHCHYLDGINGQCTNGYNLGSETLLSRIANLFIGLNYKTRISGTCCVMTSEPVSNYGFGIDQCNKQGPFIMAPALNSGGCFNYTNNGQNQLTFCVSN